MERAWYVYIARVRTGRYYTGISTDPKRRILEHNKGIGAKFTHDQGPATLVYVSLAFPNKSSARTREAQIKKWSRHKKDRLIDGEWV